MRKTLFAILPLLAACATQPVATNDLERYEQQLTDAIVNGKRGVLQELRSDKFICEVPGTSLGTNIRLEACAVVGHLLPAKPEKLFSEQANAPRRRSATIDSIEVEHRGEWAVVRMTQTYRYWISLDADFARRSQVTDFWQRDGDRWRIVRRVSNPLPTTTTGP